jgi:dTDP-4-amino-4,6-dideoxygalactose transaminase
MTNFGFAGYDKVSYIGTNGKMTEVAAIMGLTNLESLDEFVAINHRNYIAYQRALGGIPGIRMMQYDEREKCNFQYIVLEIDQEVTGIDRDRVVELLWAENILARRYFYPGCHKMEPYRSYFPHAGMLLPETERLSRRVLVLPTGSAVEQGDIEVIAQLVRLAVGNSEEIDRRLSLTGNSVVDARVAVAGR